MLFQFRGTKEARRENDRGGRGKKEGRREGGKGGIDCRIAVKRLFNYDSHAADE